jgi:hypothetical protein
MNGKIRNLMALVIALVVLLGGARVANADIVLEASIDGGVTWTTLASSTTSSDTIVVANFNLGNFTITGSASSNSPGTASLSKLLSNTLSIMNNDTGTHSILLAYGAQDFSSPVTPPPILVNSHIGGSVVTGSSDNTLAFQSYIDQGNGLGHFGIPGTYTTGSQVVNATTGSFQNDAVATISPLSATFSISQQLSITLGGGSEINTADNTTLSPVPVPATLALCLSGLPVLGLGWVRARRNKK